MVNIEEMILDVIATIKRLDSSRENSLAITKLEEALMWYSK